MKFHARQAATFTALAAICLVARAETAPNSFISGKTISASEMNENFTAAFAAITAARALGTPIVFQSPGNFSVQVPAGATRVMVEGAGGGGGGAGGNCNFMDSDITGEQGEPAFLSKLLVNVVAQETLQIVIGAGGAAGVTATSCDDVGNVVSDGGDGGDSLLLRGGTAIATFTKGRKGRRTVAPSGTCSVSTPSPTYPTPYPSATPPATALYSIYTAQNSAGSGGKGGTKCLSTSGTHPTAGKHGLMILTFM